MTITNESRPSTTIANQTKGSVGETWATISTTWASETRTWLAVSQLLTNAAKQSSTITNVSRPA